MDGSSANDRSTIRSYYVDRIRDKLDNYQDLEDLDLYLYFNALNKFDSKKYKEEKKKTKRNLLNLKLLSLKDNINCRKGLDKLDYTIEYSTKLMNQNLDNYKNLTQYSKLCIDNYSIIDEEKYLEYARYCDEFSNMSNRLVEEIKNRPSNSFLILSLIKFEEEERTMRYRNESLCEDIHNLLSNNKKIYKKR